MQISILNGIYTDGAPDIRTSYPRNLIPVPSDSGISAGYLKPAEGLVQFAVGPGADRGGICWNDEMYRVMGTKLVRITNAGVVLVLGDVGSSGQVSMDYSFDRLGIASGGRLYYWDGSTLTQVTDPDLGNVVDMLWVDGYWMTTDGEFLVVTELTDPTEVNPLKYGSSEADPDPVKSLVKIRNEVYALNRYTTEVFDNVGGDLFPFQRIEGAQIQRGTIGTHACAVFLEALAFVGSARNEAPAVWLAANGVSQKISTREIDQILQQYTEASLSSCVVETKVDKGHQHLYIHLSDQTLVYDGAASAALKEPVWTTRTSSLVGLGAYRARNIVWCYNKWFAGDPTGSGVAEMSDSVSSHYGEDVGWDFGTTILYTNGNGAIVHEMELVTLPGRAQFGDDPVIWTSYSVDGVTWSQERPVKAGMRGQTQKRIVWLQMGHMLNWRIQRFRGTSQAHISMARLEAAIEPMNVRHRNA